MNGARVAATILRHLVPALESARIELQRDAAEEATGSASTQVFDLSSAAEYLRTSTTTVRREIAAGRLPCKKLGERIYLISERALLAWVEQRDDAKERRLA